MLLRVLLPLRDGPPLGATATVGDQRAPARVLACGVTRPPRHPLAAGDYVEATLDVPDELVDRSGEQVADLETYVTQLVAERDRAQAETREAREETDYWRRVAGTAARALDAQGRSRLSPQAAAVRP